jgi:hypothetical protein
MNQSGVSEIDALTALRCDRVPLDSPRSSARLLPTSGRLSPLPSVLRANRVFMMGIEAFLKFLSSCWLLCFIIRSPGLWFFRIVRCRKASQGILLQSTCQWQKCTRRSCPRNSGISELEVGSLGDPKRRSEVNSLQGASTIRNVHPTENGHSSPMRCWRIIPSLLLAAPTRAALSGTGVRKERMRLLPSSRCWMMFAKVWESTTLEQIRTEFNPH